MEISSAHHQAMATHQLDLGQCPKSSQHQQDMKTRPQPEQALRCPRCDSSNTKFCYYNNYSLTQPRYFCKGCRRYWTQGGSLRNVPVGGGCRKNKRSSSSSSSSSSKKPRDPESQLITPTNSNPLALTTLTPFSYDPNDLTLLLGNPNSNPNGAYNIPPGAGLLDILRNGFLDSTTTTTTATNGFHNFYYGYGGNEAESGVGGGEEMGLPYEGASSKGVDGGGESNVMMGLQPWQVSGDVDSGREYWVNGAGSSSWHGLINSSLM